VKDVKAITWLMPKLVGEVKFTEWTSEGEMRHPVFLGLRSDKAVADVLRE
jgi:bifunctional non-homologous end joining protein LigD